MLKPLVGFSEHQEKATFGLGYKSNLTLKKDEGVLDEAEAIADAGNEIDHIHWYIPHDTPSIQQQGTLSKQISRKTPTELRYFERSVFMEEVNNQNLWSFELGTQKN